MFWRKDYRLCRAFNCETYLTYKVKTVDVKPLIPAFQTNLSHFLSTPSISNKFFSIPSYYAKFQRVQPQVREGSHVIIIYHTQKTSFFNKNRLWLETVVVLFIVRRQCMMSQKKICQNHDKSSFSSYWTIGYQHLKTKLTYKWKEEKTDNI